MDMSPEEQRRRRAVQRLAHLWPTGWTKHKADAYHDAISDQHADDVEQACVELARTWAEKVLPPPAKVNELASTYARRRMAEQQARLEQAHAARQEDADRPAGRLLVGNRLCHTCRGDLLYLQAERVLWCQACRAAQVLNETDGKTRIKVTNQEYQDLHLRPEPRLNSVRDAA